ncbi:hypothetical protein GCM10022234_29260 [Aeromicrobium panaciterrae]
MLGDPAALHDAVEVKCVDELEERLVRHVTEPDEPVACDDEVCDRTTGGGVDEAPLRTEDSASADVSDGTENQAPVHRDAVDNCRAATVSREVHRPSRADVHAPDEEAGLMTRGCVWADCQLRSLDEISSTELEIGYCVHSRKQAYES